MAKEYDAALPALPEFQVALAELVAELAKTDPVVARRTLDRAQVAAGPYALPSLPEIPKNALAGPEVRSGLGFAPEVDAFIEATGLPLGYGPALDKAYRAGEWGPRQVQKADAAIDRAIKDPSVGSIANAGTQTGMALMRPAVALPSLAVQYGDALVKDLGLLDTSAQAQTQLRPGQQRAMEIERQRREGEAAVKRQELETASRLKREEAAEADRLRLETEAKAAERAEYDRAVTRADEARAAELAKRKTFSDTEVGKVWNETGALAPLFMSALTGFAKRGWKPDIETGELLKWGIPAGMAASNVPLYADAYVTPPVLNPDQRAAEVYGQELPPGHPRKQEFLNYAEKAEKGNPVRRLAKDDLYDPWQAVPRNALGAMEGALGAPLGAAMWGAPARLMRDGWNAVRTVRQGPEGAPGGGGGGTPVANALSTPSTSGGGSAVNTQPASANALAGQASSPSPQPQPAASPSLPAPQSPTYKGHPLPPGVKLDKNGLPYRSKTGHKLKKDIYEGGE